MNYDAAFTEMRKGNKVKQGKCIYFIGQTKQDLLPQPYTLLLQQKSILPVVVEGFKDIKTDGDFAKTTDSYSL